jgi:hypothetical protein
VRARSDARKHIRLDPRVDLRVLEHRLEVGRLGERVSELPELAVHDSE